MATQSPLSGNGTTPCFHIVCCYISEDGTSSFTFFTLAQCLLGFPLCTYILYVAFQRWWQRRSSSTAAVSSPADVLTYHIVIMILFAAFASITIFCGIRVINYFVISLGLCCWSFAWYGEMSFHTLTCIERYFAIVHPISYLKLKRGGGMFIRNSSIVCAWLICILKTTLIRLEKASVVFIALDHIFILVIASFCSVSVFCILIRPIPGKRKRDGYDRTKQRAFIIISTSLWILILRTCWNFILLYFVLEPEHFSCVTIYLGIWVTSLSSLVTPLLFLHRAGKLTCRKKVN